MAALIPSTDGAGALAPQRPLPKKDQHDAEGFDAALERQRAENGQDPAPAAHGIREERRSQSSTDTRYDERAQSNPMNRPAAGRFLKHWHPRDSVGTPNGTDEAPSVASAETEESEKPTEQLASPAADAGDLSALTAQILGLSAVGDDATASESRSAPDGDDRSKLNERVSVDSSSPQMAAVSAQLLAMAAPGEEAPGLTKTSRVSTRSPTDGQFTGPSVDADGDVGDAIATTPIVVREVQTHFAYNANGRSGLSSTGGMSGQSTTTVDHHPREAGPPEPRRVQARTAVIGKEVAPVNVQAGNNSTQLTDQTSDPPSAGMQVLNKILDAGGDGSASTGAPVSTPTWHAGDKPFGSLLRVIRLELSPPSLGVVHVTLKGANTGLSISIEAERSQTAASLGADKANLSSRLHDAGYSVDDVVVTTLDRPLDGGSAPRSDQTAGASGNQLSAGAGDLSRRHAEDGSRRPHPETSQRSANETHLDRPDTSLASAEPLRTSPTAWRGRHAMRSV